MEASPLFMRLVQLPHRVVLNNGWEKVKANTVEWHSLVPPLPPAALRPLGGRGNTFRFSDLFMHLQVP